MLSLIETAYSVTEDAVAGGPSWLVAGEPTPGAAGEWGQAGAARDPAEPVGLSSYEAVDRQLGVKLVKQKRSVPAVVVDHVDEKPLEQGAGCSRDVEIAPSRAANTVGLFVV
ncbi:MAG TPA: DUF3738 domain-containing protein [Bryobacteraceae bacterium]|nr:DUF3738 domain-containing protein [Bryobacteraceae bacterium]